MKLTFEGLRNGPSSASLTLSLIESLSSPFRLAWFFYKGQNGRLAVVVELAIAAFQGHQNTVVGLGSVFAF